MRGRLRLSKRGVLAFLPVFGVVLWLWWFFRSYLFFILLFLAAVCVMASGMILWHSREGLRAGAALPGNRVSKGAAVPFVLRVSNPSRFFGFTADLDYSWGNVFTGSFQRERKRLWLKPGGGAVLEQSLQSLYAGRLEVRIEKFQAYDLFHIFCIGGGTEDAWTLVWPGLTQQGENGLYSCVEDFPREEESRRRGNDYNPDIEIREYIPGDDLKSVHWKLTAKQNRLMVRERLAAGREKINVLLPLSGDKRQNDALMESMYSVCLLLLQGEYPVQLFRMERGEMQSCFLAEQGELERVTAEILSGSGPDGRGDVQAGFVSAHPGERYILIQTGAYQGAYI